MLCVLTLLALGAVGNRAYAFERVNLRNGFSYDCAREQALDASHTRLYFSAADDTEFVDVPTAEIAGIDALPAPPLVPRVATAEPHRSAPVDTRTLLAAAGGAHNIDVELLASLVHAESGGQAHVVSHAGAQGLMQLMPSTAHALGVTDALAPDQNINGGTTYLDWLLTRYRDDLALALAAYNAGPAAVDRYHGIPPYRETRAYVVRVMTEFKRRKQALAHQRIAAPAPLLAAAVPR